MRDRLVNSRTKGNSYERQVRKELEKFFPDVLTSRFASKMMDDVGVDLVECEPIYPQCKNLASSLNIWRWFKEHKAANCMFYKRTGHGELVIMTKDLLYELLEKGYKNG